MRRLVPWGSLWEKPLTQKVRGFSQGDPSENPSLSAESRLYRDFSFMSYYAYILVSEQTARRYFGSCENLETRLANHNAGKVRSTKAYRPYRVLYFETFDTRAEAFARERFFKTVDGYRYLKEKGII